MNASRLRELVELVLKRERQFDIQGILSDVNSGLSNLAGNPQQQQYQTQFASALTRLEIATEELIASFEPSEVKSLEEIGAARFFAADLAAQIKQWAVANPITPAVAQQRVSELVQQRVEYITTLEQLVANFDKVNIHANPPPAGTAEIGVLIPRDLFNNQLDQLLKELGVINRIVRAFSEAATGHPTRVEVHEISTSDPLFFLGIDPVTAAAMAGAITWALNTWKQVEEIRKLRSETRKNNNFSEEEIKKFFDTKVSATIKKEIDAKVSELLPTPNEPGRANEQRTDLEWALESIFARIERGMRVELRFLPPEAEKPAPETEAAAFEKLKEVAPQLSFPEAEANPILELPPPEPDKAPKAQVQK